MYVCVGVCVCVCCRGCAASIIIITRLKSKRCNCLLLFSELIYSWRIYEQLQQGQNRDSSLPPEQQEQEQHWQCQWQQQCVVNFFISRRPLPLCRAAICLSLSLALALSLAIAIASASLYLIHCLALLNNLKHLGIQHAEMIMSENCFLTRSPGVLFAAQKQNVLHQRAKTCHHSGAQLELNTARFL